jgi:hypothetical protein
LLQCSEGSVTQRITTSIIRSPGSRPDWQHGIPCTVAQLPWPALPLQALLGQLAEACQDVPMALHVAAAALQHGDLSPHDFLRLYADPGLPAQTTVPAAMMETPLDGLANAAKDNLHRWAPAAGRGLL